MNINSPVNLQSESLTTSLPALQNQLQSFLTEYEDKVAQARAQLAHVEALLGSLSVETPKGKKRGAPHELSRYHSQKTKTKRPSLFGSDKDKIIIGQKFDEPLTELQDYI